MAKSRYYSPQLRRELISRLYHEAKRQRVPMTELASRFVEHGLNQLQPAQPTVAEEPFALDPRDRANKLDH